MMTKKHYTQLAKLINKWRLNNVKVYIGNSKVTINILPLGGFVNDLMHMLEDDNSNFNRNAFIRAIREEEKEEDKEC
jgi:hypothetical protein